MSKLKLDDHELIHKMMVGIYNMVENVECLIFGTALHKPAKKMSLWGFKIKFNYDLKGRYVLVIDDKNKPLLIKVSRWGDITVVKL